MSAYQELAASNRRICHRFAKEMIERARWAMQENLPESAAFHLGHAKTMIERVQFFRKEMQVKP